jgi:o-succinylbenzoate---CoA ligase
MAVLPLRAVEITPGPAGVQAAHAALAARMDGDGEPFALIPMPSRHVTVEYARMVRQCVQPDVPVENGDTALVAATSGSTGAPRGVLVTRDNLRAAVEASWERIPGLSECAWIVALPVTSIGGFGAIVRAHLAGTALHTLPSVGGAQGFHVDQLLDVRIEGPFAISLVPTQLSDVLKSPAATAWLADAHTVLVGAAWTPDDLVMRARQAGIALVTTYGMTETTGGCVYDGIPLPGVTIELDDSGRVIVTGRQVAAGYRGPAGSTEGFDALDGMRRFRSADHGVWDEGRLRIVGRADDVVTVHGVNVALGAIESLMRTELGIREVAVVAVPDARQGHRLVAFVCATDPAGVSALAPLVAERLGAAARPEVVTVDSLPMLPSGKIDRLALRDFAQGG